MHQPITYVDSICQPFLNPPLSTTFVPVTQSITGSSRGSLIFFFLQADYNSSGGGRILPIIPERLAKGGAAIDDRVLTFATELSPESVKT